MIPPPKTRRASSRRAPPRDATARLGGSTPQAGFLYAAIDHDFPVLLERVEARYPGLELIGCTTDGELSSSHGGAFVTVLLGEE